MSRNRMATTLPSDNNSRRFRKTTASGTAGNPSTALGMNRRLVSVVVAIRSILQFIRCGLLDKLQERMGDDDSVASWAEHNNRTFASTIDIPGIQVERI